MAMAMLALALLVCVDDAAADCAMTQTCVNPGNIPDYEACIPEANRVPQAPQPVGSNAVDAHQQ